MDEGQQPSVPVVEYSAPKRRKALAFRHWAQGDKPKEAARKAGYSDKHGHYTSSYHDIIRKHPFWAFEVLGKAGWGEPQILHLLKDVCGEQVIKAIGLSSSDKPQKEMTPLERALEHAGLTLPFFANNLKSHMDATLQKTDEKGNRLPDYATQARARRDFIDVKGLRQSVTTMKHEGKILHGHIAIPLDYLKRQWGDDKAFANAPAHPRSLPAEAEERDGALLGDDGMAEEL